MIYDSNKIQRKLIEVISKQTGRSKSKKEKLAKAIGISLPVLYKRLKGVSQFTLGEVASLIKYYNISFDDLITGQKPYAKMYFDDPNQAIYSVEDFLNRLSELIRTFSNDQETVIRYVSSEVPIFYYFQSPLLACLKLYLFARLVWKLPAFQLPNQFSMSLFSSHVIAHMQKLWTAYSEVNTVEVWHPTMWHNTLNQIVYLVEEDGVYNRDDIPQVLDEIQKANIRMKQMALQGVKDYNEQRKGSIIVYGNSLLHTNNVILAQRPNHRVLFITHDNPNYLFTSDEGMIARSSGWIDLLEDNSKLLNDNFAINHFFEQFDLKVERVRKKLQVTS